MNSKPPDNKFASARALLQDTETRMKSLLQKPMASSEPPPGKIGNVVVTTSEDDLIEALVDLRATVRPMPDKVEFVLSHIEQLLRSGELKFAKSQTRATKVTR